MRSKKKSKHAAGSVMEMPRRPGRGWRTSEAAGEDLEAGSQRQADRASPLRDAATYGSPNYLGPYTAHGTTAGHDHTRRSRTSDRAAQSAAPRGNGIFQRDMICGVRRQMFWVIIATGAFALVVTIVIGIGLGVALRNDSSKSKKVRFPLSFAPALSPSWGWIVGRVGCRRPDSTDPHRKWQTWGFCLSDARYVSIVSRNGPRQPLNQCPC